MVRHFDNLRKNSWSPAFSEARCVSRLISHIRYTFQESAVVDFKRAYVPKSTVSKHSSRKVEDCG